MAAVGGALDATVNAPPPAATGAPASNCSNLCPCAYECVTKGALARFSSMNLGFAAFTVAVNAAPYFNPPGAAAKVGRLAPRFGGENVSIRSSVGR